MYLQAEYTAHWLHDEAQLSIFNSDPLGAMISVTVTGLTDAGFLFAGEI